MILGIHSTVALARDEPHWLMSEPDAHNYARYIAAAMRHLPIHAAQKWIDFSALAGAVGYYELGRITRSVQLAGGMQAPGQRRPGQAPPRGPAQVFQFVPNPATAAADGEPEVEIPLTAGPPPEPPAA